MEEEIYGLHEAICCWPETLDELGFFCSGYGRIPPIVPEIRGGGDENMATVAKIVSHPHYPRLIEAYIDCQKVGAPPEIASLLDEIRRENNVFKTDATLSDRLSADPELDQFMDTYYDVLVKYKSDLARPFDEAIAFLNNVQLQLNDLCKGFPDKNKHAGSSEEEYSGGERDVVETHQSGEAQDLKDTLLKKYSGYFSSLKQEFSKKKKKGKLPKEARQILVDWWSIHYKWPYPTEIDKLALAELTGLDQKQISNWFINQRKRHWKPSVNLQFAVMDSLSASFYLDN